ncbi:UNVERIFIED_CONTAM: hypothetical protein ABID98_001444 [Brevibacillus sp. OAP136]
MQNCRRGKVSILLWGVLKESSAQAVTMPSGVGENGASAKMETAPQSHTLRGGSISLK